MVARLLALAIALLACGCGSGDDAATSPLLREMRSGGVVLYMRHAQAEATKDMPPRDFEDCSWQRKLTPAGREVATAMGSSITALGLPIESVLASPMCRTMDTARLAFGRAKPEVALRGGQRPDGGIDLDPIKRFFAQAPAPGRVTAIVGHESPGLGFEPMLKEGETAVIRPGAQGYVVIGRIPSERWQEWAKHGSPR